MKKKEKIRRWQLAGKKRKGGRKEGKENFKKLDLPSIKSYTFSLLTWLECHEMRLTGCKLHSPPCAHLRTCQGNRTTGSWLPLSQWLQQGTAEKDSKCVLFIMCYIPILIRFLFVEDWHSSDISRRRRKRFLANNGYIPRTNYTERFSKNELTLA